MEPNTARDRDDDLPEDRAARRRDDDAPAAAMGPLDKMFRDTNMVILIIFGVCCSGIAAILGLVGMLTAKDAVAKKNATLVLIVGAAMTILWIVVQVVLNVMAAAAGGAVR